MIARETRQWIVAGTIIVGLVGGGLYLVAGPGLRWATDTAVEALPQEIESRLALSLTDSTLLQHALVDPERVAVLERIAKLLPDAADPRTYRIAIVRDSVVNAFALPGGQLVLHTGLLARLRDESELFGVLGHEAGHVRQRHTLKQVARQLGLAAGLSVVIGDAGGITGMVAGAGRELVQRGHGRREEEESDDEGLATLRRLQLDPGGMVRVLETLQTAAGDGRVPEFISTHPAPERRIARIRAQLQALPPAPRGRILSDAEWAALMRDVAAPATAATPAAPSASSPAGPPPTP